MAQETADALSCPSENQVEKEERNVALTAPSKEAIHKFTQKKVQGFPGGAVVENPPANAGDTSSSPGLRRSHMPRSN